MTNDNNTQRSPHGVTGDTVQQAADVSKPTSPLNEVGIDPATIRTVPDPAPGTDSRASKGAAG